MRRITLWLISTVAALVLLFSYRTSTMGGGPATDTVAAAGAAGTSAGSAAGGSGSPTPAPSSPSSSSGAGSASGGGSSSSGSTAYTGSVAQTRWGPVQVAITVSSGKITGVSVPVSPNGNGRDQEINAYALPILRQETIASQSADIDAVSGATVTSDGYKESLQAAINAAHLS